MDDVTDSWRRELVLFRHAESDRGPVDFERVLSARGQSQPAPAAEALLAAGFEPDQILCSAGVRTRETLDALRRAGLGADAPVVFSRDIYECTVARLMRAICETDDDKRLLLVVGHNPGLSDLASALCGGSIGLAPGAFVRLQVLDPWAALGATRCRLVSQRSP